MAANTHLVSVADDKVAKKIKRKRSKTILTWWCHNWRAILAELVSTSLLLFIGCMTCIPIDGFAANPPLYGPIGFGFVVLFNIQAFGHISGAHMNPSVTLAAVLWGKMSIVLGIAYTIAQFAGAVMGYSLLISLTPADLNTGFCATLPHVKYSVLQALGIEIILTAALAFLVCAVWDPVNEDKSESNSIKFGLTIVALSVAGGPLTGASMNPARSFAPALASGIWTSHWVYWAGPLLGGAIAAIFYKYMWLKIEKMKEPEVLTWIDNGEV